MPPENTQTAADEMTLEEEVAGLLDGQANDDSIEETPEVPEVPEPAGQDDDPPVEEPEDIVEPLQAPDRWAASYKEAFSSLAGLKPGEPLPEGFDPRAVQEAWLEYHKERQAYVTPLEQERANLQAQFQEWERALAPYAQAWQMAGMTPIQGVSQLLAWGGALRSDPHGTLRKLAKTVGVDLGELASPGEGDEWQDPTVSALKDQVAQLQSQLVGFQRHTITERQQQEQAAINQTLVAFEGETDDQGNLLRPHYKQVEPIMASLYMQAAQQVQSGQLEAMPDLHSLYEQACWADPEVRATIQKQQQQEELTRRQQAARKADSASRSVKSKSSGSDNTKPAMSIEDEVAAIWDAQAGN